MRPSLRRFAAAFGILFGAAMLAAVLGRNVWVRAAEQFGNPVSTPPPYRTDDAARTEHAKFLVADLHADSLASARDLTKRADYGQLDLPRLRSGHVGLQVFSIVTNMPTCSSFVGCRRHPNLVALLAILQGWPTRTWVSDKARALYLAAKLRAIAADPAARLVLLRQSEDLQGLLNQPADQRQIGAVLAVEGAQAVGGDLSGVDELADAGVRILGLAHYFDNAVSGSAHGISRRGLSGFGRLVVERARQRGMIIDVAHASPSAVDDLLGESRPPPLLVSHTGLRSVCDSARNLDDAEVRRIVAAGGIIGIGAWSYALCVPADAPAARYVDRMVATIGRAVALADREHPGRGYEFIALGSDFDGWVPVGFDATGWPLLTEGLLRAGFDEAAVGSIMGGNVCRLLLRGLPGSRVAPDPDICR